MKRAVESFLLRQLSDPLPARFIDLEKTALVIKGFELDGKTYAGTEDWVEVTHAGKHGKMTRGALCKPAETITAPGSTIKKLRQKRLVVLLHDQSYESGPYDVYALPGGRGYKWWDEFDASLKFNAELPNEFSDLWVPVRDREQVFYLPWKMCTGWPLANSPEAIGSRYVIDLSSALNEQHDRMVASVY
jgi:hypothetical protein